MDIIRHYDPDRDYRMLLDGVPVFWEEVGIKRECRPDVLIRTVHRYMECGNGQAFALDIDDLSVGSACVAETYCPFNGDKLTAELYIFIYPEYRSLNRFVMLVRAIEAWSRERNAIELRIGHFGGYNHVLSKILERLGFAMYHTHFAKTIL